VSFQEIKIPPSWAAQGDTYMYNLHINALVEHSAGEQVVDFDIENYDKNYFRRRLPDDVALSQYYNNMGVHYLKETEMPLAFQYFREALLLNPNAGYLWTNLGSLYRRGERMDQAETAFLHAIELSNEPAALSNIARLYGQIGKPELEQYYEAQVQIYRRKNPYYLYSLAEEVYAEKDFKKAIGLLRVAIRHRNDEEKFHGLMGLSWVQLGEFDKAEDSFSKAAVLALEPKNSSMYTSKLQLLSQRH